MKKHVYLIGVGMGAEECLTLQSLNLLKKCDELYSTARLASLYNGQFGVVNSLSHSQIASAIKKSAKNIIGVLISGDTGFFSVAKNLADELKDVADVEFSSGLSSIQYFFAKLGLAYEGVKVLSLHGRHGSILGAATYNKYTFALTGGAGSKVENICRALSDNGLGGLQVTVGENLSLKNERIITSSANDLVNENFSDLSVILINNPNFISQYHPYSDNEFKRGNVPMSKEEVRYIVGAKLKPNPTDIIFDIGAGTGSVAIELARLAFDGLVYAIDNDSEAISLIKENVSHLKSYNVLSTHSNAPDGFKELPKPDKAFIGGSGGRLNEIFKLLFEKNNVIKVTINAITLETLHLAITLFKERGIEPDIVCLNSSYAKAIGSVHMMTANNPIYIITGGGR